MFICCGQAGLSQVSLLQNYFLVLCVPVSLVKASQRSRLTQWPENTAPSPGQAEGPEHSYPIQGHRRGREQVHRRRLAAGLSAATTMRCWSTGIGKLLPLYEEIPF